MAEIIPEVIKYDPIKLDVGITHYRPAWGIRYRWKGGNWNIVQIAFAKKSDAESWMNEHVLAIKAFKDVVEKEVLPVTRCLELTPEGQVKLWIEELD